MLPNTIPYCQVKDIKNLLERKESVFWAALLWTGLISLLCLMQSGNVPSVDAIPYVDKIVHVFFHFVFTSLWFLCFRMQMKSTVVFKALVLSFLFSFCFGIAIEILQGIFTETRKADVYDVLANVTGAFLAVFTFFRLYSMRLLKSI